MNRKNSTMNRRKFVSLTAATAASISIVPRHVLGGGNYVAPSDTITLAYIGTGTEGIREMLPMLATPQIRIVAICDCNQYAVGYKDWGPTYLKDAIRKTIQKNDWEPGGDNTIPGGRENGKSIVDTYYSNVRPDLKYKGCAAYEDVRELLDKEKNIDAVKVITPDHSHGVLAMAAMKRGKHVLMHKPVSNRLIEGKKVIDAARNSKVITHLMPWDSNGSMELIMRWINDGAIGKLTDVHNWTNRPVWPQFTELPSDTPDIPIGFNWDLWLGPESNRSYSPKYTHMVFRGWYDFGGGAMADMGHYSLWSVFDALKLTAPTMVIPKRSHVCDFTGAVPHRVDNNFSFPTASVVRFKYPANGDRPPIDLHWYDGGMRPDVPEELIAQNKDLPQEGMMFTGTKGKILAGFNLQDPVIISENKIEPTDNAYDVNGDRSTRDSIALTAFANACKSGKQYAGSFRDAEPLTDTVNLYAVALRANKILQYDAAKVEITNYLEANEYLNRSYRPGWENL